MEIIQVVGWRRVNFTDDKSKKIDGYSIYFTMDVDQEDDEMVGMMAGKMFVSIDRYQKLDYFPQPGDEVAVQYDRYGKPTSFKCV